MTSRTTLTEYLSRYNRGRRFRALDPWTKLLYPLEKQLEHYSQVDSAKIAAALAERQFFIKNLPSHGGYCCVPHKQSG